MPKILIKENNQTSSGSGIGAYANYAVLIAGFMGREPVTTADAAKDATKIADKIQPDANGIYEFSSKDAFVSTIGKVAPKVEDQDGNSFYHYGNQMAYELLNLGYSIVYMPITDIKDLKNSEKWAIFKDRATYDFRFISHGLLESSNVEDEAEYKKYVADLENFISTRKKLDEIKGEAQDLADGTTSTLADGEEPEGGTTENGEQEQSKTVDEWCTLLYEDLIENIDTTVFGKWLTDPDAKSTEAHYPYYASFSKADSAINDTKKAELAKKISDYSEAKILNTGFINDANKCIADLATYPDKPTNESSTDNSTALTGRGDCIALIELDEKEYLTENLAAENKIIDAINSMSTITEDNGRYCALTVPSVYYKMTNDLEYNNNKKLPGAFHYLACFISSLKSGFSEWYAAAGYSRGTSSIIVDSATAKLGEIAINALEPRNVGTGGDEPKFACNVIVYFRGSYYLWGNRTAAKLGSKGSNEDLTADHFLNIRQLCCTIKKHLYVSCRRFTFDPNSDTLWYNFVNAVRPVLENMKADQGIRDYRIIKEATDQKAALKAKIRIIPIEAVEDFDIEVSLEDSFGETAVIV